MNNSSGIFSTHTSQRHLDGIKFALCQHSPLTSGIALFLRAFSATERSADPATLSTVSKLSDIATNHLEHPSAIPSNLTPENFPSVLNAQNTDKTMVIFCYSISQQGTLLHSQAFSLLLNITMVRSMNPTVLCCLSFQADSHCLGRLWSEG